MEARMLVHDIGGTHLQAELPFRVGSSSLTMLDTLILKSRLTGSLGSKLSDGLLP